MQKPMSENLRLGLAHEIRVRINKKTHYLVVDGEMGAVVQRTFDDEGVEELHYAPSACEFTSLEELLTKILAERDARRARGEHVSLEGV